MEFQGQDLSIKAEGVGDRPLQDDIELLWAIAHEVRTPLTEKFLDKLIKLSKSAHPLPKQDATTNKPVEQTNPIYRFMLPKGASRRARQDFKHNIEVLRQVNPEWIVIQDLPRRGEEEAVVVMRRDENYISRQLSYLITSSLSETTQDAYLR